MKGQLDGRSVITGTSAGTVRVWTLDDGTEELKLKGHTECVTCLAMDWEALMALTGSGDRTLRLWDLEKGVCQATLKGHEGWVWCVSMNWANHRALSVSDDRTLRLWDLKEASCVEVINVAGGWAMSLSVDWSQQLALTGGTETKIQLWSIGNGAPSEKLGDPLTGHTQSVRCLAVDWHSSSAEVPKGHGGRCLSGSGDKTLRLWDLATSECKGVWQGHTASIRCVVADWTASRALSGSEDHSIRLWDLTEGVCLKVLETPTSEIRCVGLDWSCGAGLSGSLGDQACVQVWTLGQGYRLSALEHVEGVMAMDAEGFICKG